MLLPSNITGAVAAAAASPTMLPRGSVMHDMHNKESYFIFHQQQKQNKGGEAGYGEMIFTYDK